MDMDFRSFSGHFESFQTGFWQFCVFYVTFFSKTSVYTCAEHLYQRQKLVGTSILVDSGIKIKPPLQGESWPSCIPVEWRELFLDNEASLASILNRMLPADWCQEIFRQKVQAVSKCPEVDGECKVEFREFDSKLHVPEFKLTAANVRDLVAGTRILAGLLYLKCNGTSLSMRTLRHVFRLYEGNSLATPSLDVVMRSLVTKSTEFLIF